MVARYIKSGVHTQKVVLMRLSVDNAAAFVVLMFAYVGDVKSPAERCRAHSHFTVR